MLNGSLSLESEPNKGSIFGIHLPEAEINEETSVYSSVGNEFLFDDNDGVF